MIRCEQRPLSHDKFSFWESSDATINLIHLPKLKSASLNIDVAPPMQAMPVPTDAAKKKKRISVFLTFINFFGRRKWTQRAT